MEGAGQVWSGGAVTGEKELQDQTSLHFTSEATLSRSSRHS